MAFLNCAGQLIDLSIPHIMGVINITPNSFSDVGRFQTTSLALAHAAQLIAEGASILDIGGEPTNPGVHPVTSLQQELDRVIPVVESLVREFSIPISVDTSKPQVMREAIAQGATMINDVRALADPQALQVVADSKAAVCLMHMSYPQGKPEFNDGQDLLADEPVLAVKDFLQARVTACLDAGISRDRIVIDPGIGHGNFGKNLTQNLLLLNRLEEFKSLGLPLLLGVSRKTFIGELLDLPVAERLYGSIAAAVVAVLNGANLIRVHDVRPTVEAIKVAAAIMAEQATHSKYINKESYHDS